MESLKPTDVETIIRGVLCGVKVQCIDKADMERWVDVSGDQFTVCQLKLMAEDGSIRIAPALKPVDMSVLVNSGIDCEFSDCKFSAGAPIGQLTGLSTKGEQHYNSSTGSCWPHCRPRQDYWHSLHNCPVLDGEGPFSTKTFNNLRGAGFDVRHGESGKIFYFTGVLVGRCYPWEAS